MKTRIEKRPYTPDGLVLPLLLLFLLPPSPLAQAQVNSGSDGHDGPFNPTTNTVINMADHPDGIYQYTEVNIPAGVTVSFVANANNTPVVWLIQSNCTIAGGLSVNGADSRTNVAGAQGGSGGWSGGNAALNQASLPGPGFGPGGGTVGTDTTYYGGNASFATTGDCHTDQSSSQHPQFPAGPIYGNTFGLPLIGGSGGSGGRDVGGGGGGGAILVAVSGTLSISGGISARGGNGGFGWFVPNEGSYWIGTGGAGSGGAIRLVATTLSGGGTLDTSGGSAWYGYNYWGNPVYNSAGSGRIRLDGLNITFNGPTTGMTTSGFQPIIIPPANQVVSLAIQSVAGIPVQQNPSGATVTPDVIVPGQQANPVTIVVRCVNIPLNTEITLDVKPANGPAVRGVGANSAGTQASSTATLSVTMPRGAGTIQAKCVSGITGSFGASLNTGGKFKNYAQTGVTADGEVFAQREIIATLGLGQEIAYITQSGKRFVLPRN